MGERSSVRKKPRVKVSSSRQERGGESQRGLSLESTRLNERKKPKFGLSEKRGRGGGTGWSEGAKQSNPSCRSKSELEGGGWRGRRGN